jgi:hypothetical protein
MEVPAIRRLAVTERRPDMEGRRTPMAVESSRPGSRRLASTRKKCAGEKHYLSDCPYTGKYQAIVLLSEYKRKRDADKKKANFKTLGNNGATADNRDAEAAYLTAENLGVKVTVLADTGSDYSGIPRSAVENARQRGFPLKTEVLPEPIMLNMAIRREGDKQTCSATEMLMSA